MDLPSCDDYNCRHPFFGVGCKEDSRMNSLKFFFKGIRLGMDLFGVFITTLVNTLLLFLVYIIGVTMVALPAKIMKKKFLDTEKRDKSYWEELHLTKKSKEDYYRQF